MEAQPYDYKVLLIWLANILENIECEAQTQRSLKITSTGARVGIVQTSSIN